jgi:hypothetical protein
MDQFSPKSSPAVSVHVRVDLATRERMSRVQRLTNRSLPKLLEMVFQNWEENHVLAHLDAEARNLYFAGVPNIDACNAIRELRRDMQGSTPQP